MKYLSWPLAGKGRLLAVMGAGGLFVGLFVLNASRLMPKVASAPFLPLVEFGFSALLALSFLVVGSLVLLLSRDRPVARLIFAFCAAMMVTFAIETGSALNDPLLSSISSASSALALPAFSRLMLIFPKDYLKKVDGGESARLRRVFLRAYLGGQALLCVLLLPLYSARYLLHLSVPKPLYAIGPLYFLVSISGALVTILISYRRVDSVRERAQLRFFVRGLFVACTPVLLITVLPLALGFHPVDGRISTLSFGLLPLALGYAALRYQLLVYESTVRRIAQILVGASGIVVAGYGAIATSAFVAGGGAAEGVIATAAIMAVLVPAAIEIARSTTHGLFNEEVRYYNRLLDAPHLRVKEALGLDEMARRLSQAAQETFQTQEVCLLVLDSRTQSYRPCPAFGEIDGPETSRLKMYRRLLAPFQTGKFDASGLPAHHPLLVRLLAAPRPLLLREASPPADRARPADRSASGRDEILLSPVRMQDECFAVLVLGERIPRRPYSGPDFALVRLLLSRYAPLLQTARVNRELQDAYQRQKELDELKDQFIVTASHELRTPLTAVQGYIALLGESWNDLPDEMKQTFLHNAGRGADELQLLVENLTEASYVQTQAENVKLGEVSLSATVARVVEIIEAQFQQEDRRLQLSIAPHLLVLADNLRLRQVLLNLVKNALKYSPAGSPVEISADAEEGARIVVRVRDYGLGVRSEEQEHIFMRFVRLERDMNSVVRGTGLGLYICKQLVEAMGGRIWVESTGILGEGSTFCFTLLAAQTVTNLTEHPIAAVTGA